MKRALIACLIALLLPFTANAANFYISESYGNDANSGLASNAAVRSITRLEAVMTAAGAGAGDTAYFRAGDIWRDGTYSGNIEGTTGSFFTMTRYGAGANPILSGAAVLAATQYDISPVNVGGATPVLDNVFYLEAEGGGDPGLTAFEHLFIGGERMINMHYRPIFHDHTVRWATMIDNSIFDENFEGGELSNPGRDTVHEWDTNTGAESTYVAHSGAYSYELDGNETLRRDFNTKQSFEYLNFEWWVYLDSVGTTASVSGDKTNMFHVYNESWGSSDAVFVRLYYDGTNYNVQLTDWTTLVGGTTIAVDTWTKINFVWQYELDTISLLVNDVTATTQVDPRYGESQVDLFNWRNIGTQQNSYLFYVDDLRVYQGDPLIHYFPYKTLIFHDESGNPFTNGTLVEYNEKSTEDGIILTGEEFVKIDGIDLKNWGRHGISQVGGDSCQLLNMNFVGNNDHAFVFMGLEYPTSAANSNILISNVFSSHNGDTGGTFGVYVQNSTATNSIFEYNGEDYYNDWGAGFRTVSNANNAGANWNQHKNLYFIDNISRYNGLNEAGEIVTNAVTAGHGYWSDTAGSTWIYGNALHNNLASGLYIECGEYNTAYNNVIFENRHYGVRLDAAKNLQTVYHDVYNNIIINNVSSAISWHGNSVYGTADFVNYNRLYDNIVMQDSSAYKLWLDNGTQNDAQGKDNEYYANWWGSDYNNQFALGDTPTYYNTVALFNTALSPNASINPATDEIYLDNLDNTILANNIIGSLPSLRMLTAYAPSFQGLAGVQATGTTYAKGLPYAVSGSAPNKSATEITTADLSTITLKGYENATAYNPVEIVVTDTGKTVRYIIPDSNGAKVHLAPQSFTGYSNLTLTLAEWSNGIADVIGSTSSASITAKGGMVVDRVRGNMLFFPIPLIEHSIGTSDLFTTQGSIINLGLHTIPNTQNYSSIMFSTDDRVPGATEELIITAEKLLYDFN